MKHKDIQQLHETAVSELTKRALDLKAKIEAEKINRHTKPSKNVREAKFWKRDLAIITTIIREKTIMEGHNDL